MAALYATPTVPLGREVVVIVSLAGGAGLTIMLKLAVADWCVGCAESVTVIVA